MGRPRTAAPQRGAGDGPLGLHPGPDHTRREVRRNRPGHRLLAPELTPRDLAQDHLRGRRGGGRSALLWGRGERLGHTGDELTLEPSDHRLVLVPGLQFLGETGELRLPALDELRVGAENPVPFIDHPRLGLDGLVPGVDHRLVGFDRGVQRTDDGVLGRNEVVPLDDHRGLRLDSVVPGFDHFGQRLDLHCEEFTLCSMLVCGNEDVDPLPEKGSMDICALGEEDAQAEIMGEHDRR